MAPRRQGHPPQRVRDALRDVEGPLLAVDLPTVHANADRLVARAGSRPVRIATKSVRVRRVIDDVSSRPGFSGLMTYALTESLWLADHGHRDVLLAYPTTDRTAIRDLRRDRARALAVTVMVDSTDHLDLLTADRRADDPDVRICIDVDASLRWGPRVRPAHLGVRRSPLRTPRQVAQLAREVRDRDGLELDGLMFYDAQVAGLPDSSAAVRLVKRRSCAELLERRAAVVEAVRDVVPAQLVNGGGTGSLHRFADDTVVTELTAGSGLFQPTLFDGYDDVDGVPAAWFALPVVRKPRRDVATVFAGGYVASGAADRSRLPTPVWPPGLALLGTEGAGEVQTPVRGRAARDLAVGDRVWFRHAKAGEVCERFDTAHLVAADGSVEATPTYRGEGRCHG